MSVVATLISKDGSWMASDSLTTAGDDILNITSPKIYKHIDNNILFGTTGNLLAGIEIKKILISRKFSFKTIDDLYEDFYTNLLDSIVLREYDDWQVLINNGENIYYLNHGFQIMQISLPYHAIGAGEDVAIGSLETSNLLSGRLPLNGKDLIRAIDICKKYKVTIGGETQIVKL